MSRMNGKIAVVTGAGSGIGKGISIMFAAEGAKVVCADYNAAAGSATVDEIKKAGGEAVFVETNLCVKDDVKNLLKKALEAYGDVNTLVNAAGVLVHKPFLDHTDEDFEKINNTNFRAYVWMMQEFLPTLVKNGKSSITNVASISVMKPESNAYAYGAYKAAVDIMTRNLVREFTSQGVRLNVICPGPVNTNMTPEDVKNSPEIQKHMIETICPAGRLGEAKDIAYCATYLASDEAEWVTGSTFVVDGGACMMG